MKSVIDWLLGIKEESSKEVATNRMKLMVIHDRSQLPQEVMAKLKSELYEVISKYFEISKEDADFMIESHESFASIVTNTPLKVKTDIRADIINGNEKAKSKRKTKKDLQAAVS